jgi:ankyrin repeat protein
LHRAIQNGQWEAANLLVEHGANLDAAYQRGILTPLFSCCRTIGETPLHTACNAYATSFNQVGAAACINNMLINRANVTIRDERGYTAVDLISRNRQLHGEVRGNLPNFA